LRRAVRDSDTSARYGGDEFTILCEQITGEGDAIATAKRILETLSQGFEVEGQRLSISLSIGIALGGAGGEDSPRSLIRDADAAMYAAKKEGGCYRVLGDRPPISSGALPGVLIARRCE
jgi:diguanylate cyclase (GGDEF)-like protein